MLDTQPIKPKRQNGNQRRAAMYVRMSTDHQKYSIDNQADAIREYAENIWNIRPVEI